VNSGHAITGIVNAKRSSRGGRRFPGSAETRTGYRGQQHGRAVAGWPPSLTTGDNQGANEEGAYDRGVPTKPRHTSRAFTPDLHI
jgi:hypothetical protein